MRSAIPILSILVAAGTALGHDVSELSGGDELKIVYGSSGCYHSESYTITIRPTTESRFLAEIVPMTTETSGQGGTVPLSREDAEKLDRSLGFYRQLRSTHRCTSVETMTLRWRKDGVLVAEEQLADRWCSDGPDGSSLTPWDLIRRTQPCVDSRELDKLRRSAAAVFVGEVMDVYTRPILLEWAETRLVDLLAGEPSFDLELAVGVAEFEVLGLFHGEVGDRIALRTGRGPPLQVGETYFVVASEDLDGKLWIKRHDSECGYQSLILSLPNGG